MYQLPETSPPTDHRHAAAHDCLRLLKHALVYPCQMSLSRRERAQSYDIVAAAYDRVRPSYPDEVLDDLVALSGLPTRGRILELGCGSGIATLALAERGYRILALEAGHWMAALAREKLARFPMVDVEVCDVERWASAGRVFDLVLCAASYHWLMAEERVILASRALRGGGALAIVDYLHVRGGSQVFFDRTQDCYRKHMPDSSLDFALKDAADEEIDIHDLETSDRFLKPVIRKYDKTLEYDPDAYIDLLGTYSRHIRMDAKERARLFRCIRSLIPETADSKVLKRYMIELIVARHL